ncbi:hypothetical protein NEAUS06_1401 [Nematocida ausubeli]|nr:hypothetical protein NEAUS06_1401 [Nematocida ausubeli]
MIYLQYTHRYKKCILPLSHEKSKRKMCSYSKGKEIPWGYQIRMHLYNHEYIFIGGASFFAYACITTLAHYTNTLKSNLIVLSMGTLLFLFQIVFHNKTANISVETVRKSLRSTAELMCAGSCISCGVSYVRGINSISEIVKYLEFEEALVYLGLILNSIGYTNMRVYMRILFVGTALYALKIALYLWCTD